jgi:hypothetical protein
MAHLMDLQTRLSHQAFHFRGTEADLNQKVANQIGARSELERATHSQQKLIRELEQRLLEDKGLSSVIHSPPCLLLAAVIQFVVLSMLCYSHIAIPQWRISMLGLEPLISDAEEPFISIVVY